MKITKEKGFTLLEAIVAISLLLTGVLGVIVMFPTGLRAVNLSQTTSVAGQLAQEKMESIISESYESLILGEYSEASLPAPFSNFRRETEITYVDPANNMAETDIDLGIKKIEVTVSWQPYFFSSEKNIKIESLSAKR